MAKALTIDQSSSENERSSVPFPRQHPLGVSFFGKLSATRSTTRLQGSPNGHSHLGINMRGSPLYLVVCATLLAIPGLYSPVVRAQRDNNHNGSRPANVHRHRSNPARNSQQQLLSLLSKPLLQVYLSKLPLPPAPFHQFESSTEGDLEPKSTPELNLHNLGVTTTTGTPGVYIPYLSDVTFPETGSITNFVNQADLECRVMCDFRSSCLGYVLKGNGSSLTTRNRVTGVTFPKRAILHQVHSIRVYPTPLHH
ncbi:hypothetical protein M427DRAFT_267673 [Gonapodya prolifera JEL478]|uniref:Uncharacterized protein n=1 Tax=Gonapodya prolifera (strain JEL478) TaxID=1344416 RepID=A0A139AJG2_GONPJ|nr:hypothetical protein M427DRAFT_267673 [Gonapodya prolifera JEL478]|eukprot:KXS16922.1 hypothetical protein M427DRAFT_267673 [Gonapodya prolifera JEL478]